VRQLVVNQYQCQDNSHLMQKSFRPPNIAKWIFHRRVWGFSVPKKVYLTFDDGPTPELTRWILDTLKEKNVKATFFCVGENAVSHPNLMQEIKADGHAVGNHTMRHEKGISVSKSTYLQSISEAAEVIDSKLFRPPYGRMPARFSKKIEKNFKIVMWTWLSYDYDKNVPLDYILLKAKSIREGDILVLHDNVKTEDRLKILLPQLIDLIQAKGLEFDVISA
jgi:peptidoglycan/xylan/chitin deacetylase (PgdA/CDA1 family)